MLFFPVTLYFVNLISNLQLLNMRGYRKIFFFPIPFNHARLCEKPLPSDLCVLRSLNQIKEVKV